MATLHRHLDPHHLNPLSPLHFIQRIVLDKKKLSATDGRPGLSLWGVMQAAIIHGALPTFIASGELWRSSLGSVFHGTKSAVELQVRRYALTVT